MFKISKIYYKKNLTHKELEHLIHSQEKSQSTDSNLEIMQMENYQSYGVAITKYYRSGCLNNLSL